MTRTMTPGAYRPMIAANRATVTLKDFVANPLAVDLQPMRLRLMTTVANDWVACDVADFASKGDRLNGAVATDAYFDSLLAERYEDWGGHRDGPDPSWSWLNSMG